MFDRPANAIAALIAAGAIVVSLWRALPSGFEPYSLITTVLGLAMLLVGAWWLLRQAPGTPFHDCVLPCRATDHHGGASGRSTYGWAHNWADPGDRGAFQHRRTCTGGPERWRRGSISRASCIVIVLEPCA